MGLIVTSADQGLKIMAKRRAVIRIVLPGDIVERRYTGGLILAIIMTLNDNNQTADLYYEDVP